MIIFIISRSIVIETKQEPDELTFRLIITEKNNGEKWLIDATTACGKALDVPILNVFLRFMKVGVLFVGKKNSYLLEITRPQKSVQITHSIIDEIIDAPTKNSELTQERLSK